MKLLLFLSLAMLMLGCANPINRATAFRYSELCREEELAGRLDTAENMCYRAVKNTQWGFLSVDEKSFSLLNLARIKRKRGKFDEAIQILRLSIQLEERKKRVDELELGKRWAEMGLTLCLQERFSEAAPLFRKLLAVAEKYDGSYRREIGKLFHFVASAPNTGFDPSLSSDLAHVAQALMRGQ